MAKTNESVRSGPSPLWMESLLESLMAARTAARLPGGGAGSAWERLQRKLSEVRADSFLEWLRAWQWRIPQDGRVLIHVDLSEALYRAEAGTWLPNVVVLWEKTQTELVEVRDGRVV